MFIDSMLSETAPLEQQLQFTEARQNVIADNIANATTPGYRQKDLSVAKFNQMLGKKIEEQKSAPPGSVKFDDIQRQVENPRAGILFHDGNNRSMEQMMSENAKNALMHNMVVELLRAQYSTMQAALKERL